MVVTKSYTEPPICKKEILRYAGCKNSNQESLQFSAESRQLEELLDDCLEEVLPKLSYKVCFMELPLAINGTSCDFDCMKLESKDLVKNLQGCEKVILFAATIGVEIDRFIMKYGAISPAKAMMFQAIGAERIESLCDAFCAELENEGVSLRPRFSPGYGDLSIEMQKDIFQVLNCNKNIGISLNDSLLMSPSKSVTAFVGVSKEASQETKYNENKCAVCQKIDCVYRGK